MKTGEKIAHFEIIRTLGQGGMGEVYLALDQKLRRQVALKILPSIQGGDEQARKRLLREAQSAATLDHPNICAIYEIGEDQATSYIAMQYIDGDTLSARMRARQLSLSESIGVAMAVADALAEAHKRQLVHRDIKPANIMIDSRGQAKVLDFGLAKTIQPAALEGETNTMLSTPGMIMGTVPYMSPEQVRGERVDSRTDIFSFGVLLYEMLFGEAAFARPSNAETIGAILMEEPPALSSSDARIPRPLKEILARCLKKKKDDRYQTMTNVVADLKAVSRTQEAITEAPTVTLRQPGAATVNIAPEAEAAAQSADAAASARPRSFRTVALVMIAIALLGLASYFAWSKLRPSAASLSAIDSIAVLPLVNDSGDASKEYLSDGISESLIGSLAQIPNVKVTARNSAFQFKGKQVDYQAIAQKLKVRGIVSGHMRQESDDLVINIEFDDAADGHAIFNQTYRRKASELVNTETNIVQDVIARMHVKLSPEQQQQIAKQPTANNDAYQLFLKGMSVDASGTEAGLHEAIAYYGQAVELDPNFALDYALMAQSYVGLSLFERPNDTMPQARRFAEKAVQLDDSLADAHATLGLVHLLYDWDYDAAQRELTLSGKFNPEAIPTYSCAAHILESTGRLKEAEQEVRTALVRDPLSQVLFDELGCTSYYARDFESSVTQSTQAVTRDPLDPVARWNLTRALNQKKSYQESIDEIKTFQTLNTEPLPLIDSELAYAYARSGKPDDAKAIARRLTDMSKHTFVDPYLLACIYIGLGDKEQTIAWLTKSYEIKSAFLVSAQAEPKFDPIRSDPRFQNILKRIGFQA